MKKLIYILIVTLGFCVSCKSTELVVNNDATSREIVQMAQSAYNSGNTDEALRLYGILLQRYGMDDAVYIEGRFEIAHIYIKQKKYNEAKIMLEEIISMYESRQPGSLPGAFKKLALNDLEKIPQNLEEK